jgi:DNA polymerase-3 subunit alpha
LEAFIKAGAFDLIAPHRATIMASLNRALQRAEQTTRDQAIGQHDLFGGSHTQENTMEYVSVPEWSEQQRLFGEKETLGLYLTGHPIHRYLPELKNFTSNRIAELRPSAKTVVVAGIIINLRTIQTKRGDRMAVVTLDDATTPIDVLCFAENYQKYRELLGKDKLIVVEGEVSVDDFSGGYRLLSREIFSIDAARERYAKYLQIRLSPTFDVVQLAPLLEKYRGGRCSVAVDYWRADAKANLKLGEAWRVKPMDSLLDTLRDVFSSENVDVVY